VQHKAYFYLCNMQTAEHLRDPFRFKPSHFQKIQFIHTKTHVLYVIRDIVVDWGTVLKVRCLGFDSRRGHWIFHFTKFLKHYYGPGMNSASRRVENMESSWERGRRLKLTTLSPSVTRLSTKFGSLNVSQQYWYGPPRLVTGTVLITDANGNWGQSVGLCRGSEATEVSGSTPGPRVFRWLLIHEICKHCVRGFWFIPLKHYTVN
jgi:hypothetical protein